MEQDWTKDMKGCKDRIQKNKGNKRNKTEVWLQKGKNFQGLLVGDRLYIEESQYTPRTPHETLATYTGAG